MARAFVVSGRRIWSSYLVVVSGRRIWSSYLVGLDAAL
jgi:hypothetical protein